MRGGCTAKKEEVKNLEFASRFFYLVALKEFAFRAFLLMNSLKEVKER